MRRTEAPLQPILTKEFVKNPIIEAITRNKLKKKKKVLANLLFKRFFPIVKNRIMSKIIKPRLIKFMIKLVSSSFISFDK